MKRMLFCIALGCAGAAPEARSSTPSAAPPIATAVPSSPAARGQKASDGSPADPGADEIVRAACDAYIELLVRHDPEEATDLGRHEYDAKLTDRSDPARKQEGRTLLHCLRKRKRAFKAESSRQQRAQTLRFWAA